MALRELTPQDREALYRVLAYEARRGVDATTGSDRDQWLSVERQWETLACKADVDIAAAPMATPPYTKKYYIKMAAKLEALSDYARSDPEVNSTVAENLKSFAANILKDVA